MECKDEDLAPCGLYCGACGVRVATQEDSFNLKSKISKAFGLRLADIRCSGCNSGETWPYARVCQIKACVRERHLEGCHQCPEFPCSQVNSSSLPEVRNAIHRCVCQRREMGDEMFLAAEKERYTCSGCGKQLYRGQTKCFYCKADVNPENLTSGTPNRKSPEKPGLSRYTYEGNGAILNSVGDVTDLKQIEDEKSRLVHDLRKRIKELNCLYSISSLEENENLSLEELFQGIVNIVSKSWQYPDLTCAKIVFEGKEVMTDNFQETGWRQCADIKTLGEKKGFVEVCYLKEMDEQDEGPFLMEERALINAVAERLGKITKLKHAEEELEHRAQFHEPE